MITRLRWPWGTSACCADRKSVGFIDAVPASAFACSRGTLLAAEMVLRTIKIKPFNELRIRDTAQCLPIPSAENSKGRGLNRLNPGNV